MLVIRIDKGLEKDFDKDLIAMALETPNLGHTVCVNQVSAGNTDSQRAFRPYIGLTKQRLESTKKDECPLISQRLLVCFRKDLLFGVLLFCKTRGSFGSRVREGEGYFNPPPPLGCPANTN